MNKIYLKQSAFTLIELLIAIFVIGIIVSLSTIYFSQVKKNNRDYKRLSDISEIQLALENYKFFEGRYPESISSSTSLIGSTTGMTFLEKIPVSPEYNNDDCSITSYEYSYDEDNKTYGLQFCLEGKIENYTSGVKCLFPGGIKNGTCQALALSGSLDNGETGVAYGPYTFSASGGLAPYSFSISSGTLPTGLSLNSSGVLSGTPTLSGDYSFSVEVADSLLNTSSAQFNMTILWGCGSDLVDSRDNNEYDTVQLDTQCWMAENLNVGTMINGSSTQSNNSSIEKYCYNNDSNNCNTYGGLYQWDEAMQYTTSSAAQGICPSDWHIPSNDEWTTLTGYLSANSQYWCGASSTQIAKSLAATSSWGSVATACAIGNGQSSNNTTGFNASPAGYRFTNGVFDYINKYVYFWSSSLNSQNFALYFYLNYNDAKVKNSINSRATVGYSIRCLKN